MKTYDLKHDDGKIFAFEVDNTYLSRYGLYCIVTQIPGCTVLKKPKQFRWPFNDEDEFCEFEFDGVKFVADEPWSDSDRYWIGPKSIQSSHIEWCPQTDRLRQIFIEVNPIAQAMSNGKGYALTSVILGIIGIPLPFPGIILGILAIIFGFFAKNKMKQIGNFDGKGMATAGIVLGIVSCLWILVAILIIIAIGNSQ